jgi:glycosyltransferase involved in cell wall biosynthesis
MKILYITPDLTNPGGIARVVAVKANYFVSEMDYQVNILALNKKNTTFFYDFNPKILWSDKLYAKNKIIFLWSYIHFIKKTITQKKPEIIIVCDAFLWVLIPWFVKTNIPILFETHVSKFLKKNKKQNIITKIKSRFIHFLKQITLKKFNKVVFLTHDCFKEWKINNAIVIPNPITFLTPKKAALENKRVIVVSRYSYEKGIDRLLFIWEKINKIHPDWELDIYGEWKNSHYQQMTNDLQISNNVNFIAPTQEIQNYYAESSIYLMTSRSEAFPLVLLEAMSCGLPCIAYNCPSGPRNIIEDNITGFLIEDGHENVFVEKLDVLMKDINLRKVLGKSAVESSKKYELSAIMSQWDTMFKSINKEV